MLTVWREKTASRERPNLRKSGVKTRLRELDTLFSYILMDSLSLVGSTSTIKHSYSRPWGRVLSKSPLAVFSFICQALRSITGEKEDMLARTIILNMSRPSFVNECCRAKDRFRQEAIDNREHFLNVCLLKDREMLVCSWLSWKGFLTGLFSLARDALRFKNAYNKPEFKSY